MKQNKQQIKHDLGMKVFYKVTLELGDIVGKEAVLKVIQMLLNGERFPGLLMTI